VNKKISEELSNELKKYGQFPYGKRGVAYQTIDDHKGIRDMEHRFELMSLPDSFEGKTVIDIGCNVGAVCIEAKKRGAARVVGIDYKKETINVAKKIAEELEIDIEYFVFNIDNGLDALKKEIGSDKFNYTFALSIYNHVNTQKLVNIVSYYTGEICWFEGHALKSKKTSRYYQKNECSARELTDQFNCARAEFLGASNDRGTRHNFKLYY
jgi:2-polyprenyl-3-methyl-5-hydroxy-6-metoxy-1,4-benzoquinol methylase